MTLDAAEMRKDDGKGQISDEKTETFSSSDKKIHCYIHWENPKSGITIKFVYIAVDAGTLKNETIKEVNLVTVNDTDNLAHSSLTPNRPFPKGSYKVDIYLNDKLARTVEYEID